MTFRRAALVLAACFVVAGCDHGSMLVGDNRSGQDLLARAVGNDFDSTDDAGERFVRPAEIVVVLPAHTRLVIAKLPFRGGFSVQRVDILAPDCTEIGTLAVHGHEGTLVEIADDLTVRLREEYPESGELAETTDRCHTARWTAPSRTADPSP